MGAVSCNSMVLTLKLGALALLSTVGTLWNYGTPFGPESSSIKATRDPTAIACALRYGVSGAEAARFMQTLQTKSIEAVLEQGLSTKSPLHAMFRSVSKENRSAFEDCAGLEPGYATMAVNAKRRESSYRAFLRSCMACAGAAFRESGEAWPTEGVMLDMIEMVSLDWLQSATHMFHYAAKYKPAISALPAPVQLQFRGCMQQVKDMPGSPGYPGMEGRRRLDHKKGQRPVSMFDQIISDVTGRGPSQPIHMQAATAPVSGSPSRRLMKGGSSGFSFSSYGGGDGETVDSCLGHDGVVSVSGLEKRIADLEVGDLLTTTVDKDEVWYIHSVEHPVNMVRLVLRDSFLELTKHHLVSTADGMRLAGDVKPGDGVWQQKGAQRSMGEVIEIVQLTGRVSAPITKSGTIVVNGVVASCYAHGTQDLIHLTLAPVRALHSVWPALAVSLTQFGYHYIFHPIASLVPLQQHMDLVMAVSFGITVIVSGMPVVVAAISARRART